MITKIEELIIESLKMITTLSTSTNSTTRILIPNYRKNEKSDDKSRYSEQELKQIFINKMLTDSKFYYSVETPTKYIYAFSNFNIPQIEKKETSREHFESARFDLSLYDKDDLNTLLTHIEFKHKNPPDEKDISKDLLKLTNEMGGLNRNYFVHYLVHGNKWKTVTFPNLMEKYSNALKNPDMDKEQFKNVYVYLMFYNPHGNAEHKILCFNLEDFNNKYEVGQVFDENKLTWMIIL